MLATVFKYFQHKTFITVPGGGCVPRRKSLLQDENVYAGAGRSATSPVTCPEQVEPTSTREIIKHINDHKKRKS